MSLRFKRCLYLSDTSKATYWQQGRDDPAIRQTRTKEWGVILVSLWGLEDYQPACASLTPDPRVTGPLTQQPNTH